MAEAEMTPQNGGVIKHRTAHAEISDPGCSSVTSTCADGSAGSQSTRQIRIISRRNGVGLDRDVALLSRALSSYPVCDWHHVRSFAPVSEAVWSPWRNELQPINVFVERVPLHWVWARGKSVLIPNQERFPHRHLWRLRAVDLVCCKSRHAEQLFRQFGVRTRYTGFTSDDRNLDDVVPNYGKFFHLAGRSTLKGTEAILSLWKDHPEWPTLTLVQCPENAPSEVPKNVHLISQYIDDDALRQLQNQHGIHLCPSLSEGWGHYIAEAMSCSAVVLTTNAPPMNELVEDSRGVLVPWSTSSPRHLGTNFKVDVEQLQIAIKAVMTMRATQLESMGNSARAWFEKNDRSFALRFADAIGELDASPQRSRAA